MYTINCHDKGGISYENSHQLQSSMWSRSKKDDCKREPAHCHITRNGYRVAQVWLNPVSIESGHSLDRNEIDDIISVVSSNRYELEREYRNNAEYGAD